MEKRQNYVKKVAELTNKIFISYDRPNVKGLVFAGSADFKNELADSEVLDQRLKPLILAKIDVSYGEEKGLSEALTLAGDVLTNVRYVAEKKLVSSFF